jgi:hypothetical protein
MRRPKLGTLSKSFDALLIERRSLIEKEQGLIMKLNKVLSQIGYRVERDARGGQGTASRKPRIESRPELSALKSSNNHRAEEAPKRRGRPPLRKVA